VNVTLLDYGAGNTTSVERALTRLGAQCFRTSSGGVLSGSGAILLPGVGHFAALLRTLDRNHLRRPLVDAIARGVPFLGICLGLQVLFRLSDEAPDLPGLGILECRVERLPATAKLPHMGWNQVNASRDSVLLCGIPDGSYFYFAHSYAAAPTHHAVVATSTHGAPFAAVVEQKNIFAVQFHPEKSAAAGSRVLENFLRFAA